MSRRCGGIDFSVSKGSLGLRRAESFWNPMVEHVWFRPDLYEEDFDAWVKAWHAWDALQKSGAFRGPYDG